MPSYWPTYWRNQRYRRRQRWFPRRRATKTFRRRRWRRRKYRRTYYKVNRRRFYKKKKKTLKLKVFQPKTINRCKIVGFKPLFQGDSRRASFNYIQSIYAYVPDLYPGGGGWSLMIYTLDSLFEDYQHLENIWTKSNAGLPLVRFLGGKFKLYQSDSTDYIFIFDSCWPMVDTKYTHADSAPFRMLQKRHKVIMPSKQTSCRKKPYKIVKFKPPAQMTNNWYFQQDIHKTPLVMTTCTAVDLSRPFCKTTCTNNNVTLWSLNPYWFQNPNFQHFPEKTGYSPKSINEQPIYLYASLLKLNSSNKSQFVKQLIFLGNTKENIAGEILNSSNNSKSHWGNPFYHRYIERTPDTSYTIYYSTSNSTTIVTNMNNPTNLQFVEITGPIAYSLRYNPMRDTGENNKIYIIKTTTDGTLNPPDNENFIFEGFPLFYLLWGWPDWIKKLNQTTNLENNYLLIIQTKMFDESLPFYILLDIDFLDGYDPYQTHGEQYQTNWYNHENWFPKLQYQIQSIENLCKSGPLTTRNTNYLQAYMKYYFYFKFGGCPQTLEKAYDPSLQSKWPTADNVSRRIEIQNPNTAPQTELYEWDWQKDYVKKSAIERIKYHTPITEQILSSTESKNNPQALKVQEKTKEDEEEAQLFQQLHQLRHQRMLLQLKCQLKLAKYS
nr:MAG: ORF1 [TTV-like mini virus]